MKGEHVAITDQSVRLVERSLTLTGARFDRRQLLQGAASSAAAMAFAGTYGTCVFALATPEATAVAFYDGPLAEDQSIRLPSGEPATMDPAASTGLDELDFFFNTYDGLTGVDQVTGEVVGRVAESWEPNDDATVFTFHLKQDATWSDGTPLTANDFVYSWRRVLDPNTLSEYVPAMFYLLNGEEIASGTKTLEELGVAAIDDYTLEVTLSGPLAFFPLITTTWTYFPVPQHVIDEKGDAWT
jgi:oligopeptide transport system substrate-binding protein